MSSGSTTSLLILAAVVLLVSGAALFLPGSTLWRQGPPQEIKAPEGAAGVSCPLPSDLGIEGRGDAGLTPELDRRVLASGRRMETATFALG